jgi:hypothetical protein
MLPHRLILATYVGRHLRSWAALRVGLSGLFLYVREDPLRLTPWTVCAVIGLCVAVSVIELQRRRERDLLGNLGVSVFTLGVLLVVPPLMGELVVAGLGALRA